MRINSGFGDRTVQRRSTLICVMETEKKMELRVG